VRAGQPLAASCSRCLSPSRRRLTYVLFLLYSGSAGHTLQAGTRGSTGSRVVSHIPRHALIRHLSLSPFLWSDQAVGVAQVKGGAQLHHGNRDS
jgi:hypothetical protein